MSNRRINYKVEIDWRKVKHIRPKIDDKTITLEVKPTNKPLPRVMVITNVSDPVLFGFCVYSWVSVLYPKHLLNWVIIDSNERLTKESLGSCTDDPRIRVVTKKYTTFNHAVSAAMEMDWVETKEVEKPVSSTDVTAVATVEPDRPLYYTLMDCGDVWFPDTLGLKFRALEEGYDCVIADTLAYYSPFDNTNLAYKLFLRFPRGGLYWKKRWWTSKSSSKMIGIPYLGNSITIGKPAVDAIPHQASVRFFDNFPADVKAMIRKILIVSQAQRDELSSDSEDEEPQEKSSTSELVKA